MKTVFPSITSLNKWAGVTVSFVEGIPYVLKDGLFYYFTQDDKKNYRLAMTSLTDLGEQKP